MIEIGTYNELISSSSSFAHLLEDIHQQRQEFPKYVERHYSISSASTDIQYKEQAITNIDTKQEGSIKWNVYILYMRAGLGCTFSFFFILLILFAHQATYLYSNWWLANWSDDESHRYRNFTNCTSVVVKNINHIHSMSENEWNIHRNQRFYTYCGKSELRTY